MQRMNRGVAAALMGAAGLWLCACSARADVVASWNFNQLAGSVPPAVSADAGSGAMQLSDFTGGLGILAGTDINALVGDAAGQGLTITGSGQNGRSIVVEVRTVDLAGVSVSVAARRSTSGFAVAAVEAWDGAAWQRGGSFDASTTQWTVHAFDLSVFEFLNRSETARIRFKFEGATSSSGNIRLDNLRVEATPVPAPGGAAAIGAVAAGITSRRRGRGGSAAKANDRRDSGSSEASVEGSCPKDQREAPPSSVPGSTAGARRSARARSGRTSG
jgi:hypothetical protein